MNRIAFIVQLPKGISPAQRFRCEAWEPTLAEAGYTVDTYPFFDQRAADILYKNGYTVLKILAVLRGFCARIVLTATIHRYNVVFIQREASPVGPPVFEWIWCRLLRKKVIYDFDDAIWIPNTSVQNRLATGFKAFWKIGRICRWAHTVVGGNDFLCVFARQHSVSGNVVRIPTLVDTEQRYNQVKDHKADRIVVGWTGSHSTLKYLDQMIPALIELQDEFNFTFIVIADKKPDLPLKNWQFVPWNPATEIEDLLRMDIGIMPLTADAWSEGKCGFKLIQYLALGIPAIASPVGVNKEIIEERVNGYLATDNAQWQQSLRNLITDIDTRKAMGAAGRNKVEAFYSLNAFRRVYLSLFAKHSD